MSLTRIKEGLALATMAVTSVTAGASCSQNQAFADDPIVLEDPAPITGGTLLLLNDTGRAVVSDTDLDRIVVIDLAGNMSIEHTIMLNPNDEPGRVIEGPNGSAIVALRRGGGIAVVAPDSGEMTRHAVCPAPRGLAYDAAKDELHVACAGGELVTLRGDLTGPPLRSLRLPADLRDVVISGDQLLVSRFRSAELLLIGPSGAILNSSAPHGMVNDATARQYGPAVAWKMIPLPSGEALVLHQRGLIGTIPTNVSPSGTIGGGYYGVPCQNSIVHAAVSFFDSQSGTNVTGENLGDLGSIVLPVDVALSSSGTQMAVLGAGDNSLFIISTETARQQGRILNNCAPDGSRGLSVPGEPVSIAYSALDTLYVQTRQPAQLRRINKMNGDRLAFVDLPDPDRRHWGHALFHRVPSATSAIACASCHPEGHEDGRVWEFHNIGQRRTQTVAGGVMSTLPLHWDGDMHSLDELMKEVFVTRMGGQRPPEEQTADMGRWMDTIGAIPASPALDPAAASRGEALFNSEDVGCAKCHSGAMLTNNDNADVGTGKALQVPSLNRIAQRAPFMHNGCAPTLLDRFVDPSCGGGDAHGKTSQLSSAELNDLVSYLNTL